MAEPDSRHDQHDERLVHDNLFRLVYRSRDCIAVAERKLELGRLFSRARSKNKALGVTGALLLTDEYFVQTLEGEEAVVRDLFALISQDPRHDRVELLEAHVARARVFPRWSMAQVTGGDEDIPLIAHTDGISPAASRGTTKGQQALLATMRQAAATQSA